MTTAKTLIDTYYSNNHNKLREVAKNCLGKINKKEYIDDIISESYIYITSLTQEITEKNLESIIVNYINRQVVWNQTAFKSNIHPQIINHIDEYHLYSEQEDIDKQVDEQENKLEAITNYTNQLPYTQKQLFNLVYIQGINTSGKLERYFAKKGFKLSRTSWWIALKKLRDDVKKT